MANQISLTFPDTTYNSSSLPSSDTLSTDLNAVEVAHNNLDTESFTKDGAKAMTGDLDMGGNTITNLNEPVADDDAARKVDASPVGAVTQFAGAVAPTSWLLCRGQEISRVTYADLFAIIGETYGAGDGSSTFLLPDIQGKTIFGVSLTDTDFDLGDTSGAKTYDLSHVHSGPSHSHDQTDHNHTMSHNHSFSDTFTTTSMSSGTKLVTRNYADEGGNSYFSDGGYKGDVANHTHGGSVSGTTGGSSASHTGTRALGNTGAGGTGNTGSGGSATQNVMNPNIALNFIIKT